LIDLRRLQYFVAVAEHGTMAKAVDAVGVAQPTLSQQIRALEHDLGTILFDRTGRGMELTEAGRTLRDHALPLIAQAQAARVAITELEGVAAGELRIGAIPTFNTAFLPRVVARFAERYPGVRLTVEQAPAQAIESGIMAGRYDLGIAFAPPHHAELGVKILFEERLALVVAKDHPLAASRIIPLSALDSIPLALLTHAFATRRLLDRAVEGRTTLQVRIEMNSIEALLALARDGTAPTVLTDKSLGSPRDLAIVPIGPQAIRRKAALLWPVHRYNSAAARAFLDMTAKLIPEYARVGSSVPVER